MYKIMIAVAISQIINRLFHFLGFLKMVQSQLLPMVSAALKYFRLYKMMLYPEGIHVCEIVQKCNKKGMTGTSVYEILYMLTCSFKLEKYSMNSAYKII